MNAASSNCSELLSQALDRIRNLGITLEESTHTYYHRGKALMSAGQIVKSLTPKFDAKAAAARRAERDNTTQEAVLAQWAQERERAADKGHALHQFIQAFFHNFQPLPYPPIAYREARAWVEWFSKSGQNLRLLGHELIVGCPDLGFAGTLDSLFASSRTMLHHVLDWKSNKEFRVENKWGDRMLWPFDDLPACHHSEYSIQLSLYRLALDTLGLPTGQAWVVHLGDKASPHRMIDLRARLARHLTERKK